MTAFTLGEATATALARMAFERRAGGNAAPHPRPRKPHRTGVPVRRDSIEAGTFEDMFFAVPGKGESDRLLRLARAALDAGRRAKRTARIEQRELTPLEHALAAISAGAVRVYEELCTLARLNRGRVYPSYDRLAEATALGRATVARALDALEDAGFLVRQRRFRRIEGEGAGPRWEQTSNVYRLTVPARIIALLPHWLRPAPPPADAVQRQADEAEEMARLRGQLTCRELAQVTVRGPLGRALARLGQMIDGRVMVDERESHDDPEPLSHFIDLGQKPRSFGSTRHTIGNTPDTHR